MDEVKALLESINLGCYVEKFEEEGWDDLETVLSMTENDIKTCIPKNGHVRKLYLTIQKIFSDRKNESSVDKIKEKEENDSAKTSSSTSVSHPGSLADGETSSEGLHESEDNQLNNTPSHAERMKIKHDTVAVAETVIPDVHEKTQEHDTKDITGIGNKIVPNKDHMIVQMRETCKEICSKDEVLDQPIQDMVSNADLPTLMRSKEILSVCSKEMKTYRGDMPLCTYVSESENVTIAKNVSVQHVTKHFEAGQKKYKDQMHSVLDGIEEKHQKLIVETRAFAEVNNILEDCYWAVIIGNPGEGKTTMGHHLLRQYRENGFEPLIINSIEDWKNLVDGSGNEKEKQFILIDDIFGTISVDERKVNDWASMFEMIEKLLNERNGNLKVLCTLRTLIYSEVETKLGRFKCFQKIQMVDISEKQFSLQESEKSEMLEKYLKYYNIELDTLDFFQIISGQQSHGFPHCIEMFCTNVSLRQKGLEFFLNPIRMLKDEFENLYESDKHKFCALVMLVVASIKKTQVSMFSDEEQKTAVFEIAVKLSEPPPTTTLQDINHAFSLLRNTYIDISDDDMISFRHPSFYEMVCIIVTKHNPVVAIEFLDIEFLTSRTKSHDHKKDMLDEFVILPKACNKFLVKRFTQALRLPHMDILRHNAWNDSDFINLWISHVTQQYEGEKCLLLQLLELEFRTLTFFGENKEYLLSLFALNKHEQLVIKIIQNHSMQHVWSTLVGVLQLSRALISASRSDCSVNLLECLVQSGANINHCIFIRDILGTFTRNALYFTVVNNNVDKTRMLLQNGATESFLSDTDSVFIAAIQKKNMDMFLLLLNYLKTQQSNDVLENSSHMQHLLFGENYVQLLSSQLENISICISNTEDQSFLKDVLCCVIKNGISISERNLFNIIVNAGSTKNVEQMMEILNTNKYCFDDLWRSCDFDTVIKSQNSVELLEVFQRYGLIMDTKDVHGNTILHNFIPDRDHRLFEYVLHKYINEDIPNENCDDLLKIFFQSSFLLVCIEDIVKLIECSDVCKIRDKFGKNCFHLLAMSRHAYQGDLLQQIIDLFSQKGCDINEVDSDGTPPVFFCNFSLLKVFIEKGANPTLANNKKMTMAMELVQRNERNILDMLSTLSECGLDLTIADENKRNILHYVGDSKYSSAVKEQLFVFLLSKGVDINKMDTQNITPLMTVVQNPASTARFVHFTFQNGADLSEKDIGGLTVFHHCIKSGMPEYAKIAILDKMFKEDINIDQLDLLSFAIENAEKSIIDFLVNSWSFPLKTVFNISKDAILNDCKSNVYDLYSLLTERYGPSFKGLVEQDEDFQKTLLRDLCEQNIYFNVFDVFPEGINVEWLNTIKVFPYHLCSSSENVRKIFFCKNAVSLENNFCKCGQFELLIILLRNKKQWIVSENELPEILQSIVLCTDEKIALTILESLFSAKENCIVFKRVRYTTLKHWCKQPHLHISCIRLLLKYGDTEIIDEKEESLVFCVIEHFLQNQLKTYLVNYPELVKELIKFNFKSDVPNINGVTPLMLLLANGNVWYQDLVDVLISKSENLCQKDYNGCNVLHYVILSSASDEKKAHLVESLLERGVPIVENNYGVAPFHVFVNYVNKDYILTLKCFLHSSIKKHKLIDLILNTIPRVSITLQELEHFIKIFEESNIDARTDVDITGSSFLAQSARWLSPELVSYFIQKETDLNKSDILGHTPMHRIILSSDLMVYTINKCIYFEESANIGVLAKLKRPNLQEGKMVIHRGCLNGVNKAMKCLCLLLEHGADPNVMDFHGKTPLHYCAESPLFDAFICPAMNLLISNGADVNREDFEGRTPLMLCLQFAKTMHRRLNILITAKANLFTEDYNCSDIFHYAQKGIGVRVFRKIMEEQMKEI